MEVEPEVDLLDVVQKLARRELDGWAPQSAPQYLALICPAYEVLYGGAAGGGKTDVTLADHLRDALCYPFYKGVIFRRTYPELDEVIQRARWFFPAACPEVAERDGGHEWKFPLGGRLLLRHLKDYKAALAHKSAEYTKVTFEELTTFEERQYVYLMTRARSSKGVPISIRSTTNPGGLGHAWVFARFAPWLDPNFAGKKALPGEIRWFIPGPKSEDIWVPEGTPGALSRTFIPAKLSDNKMLTNADPAYEHRLNATDPLTREQLKNGNWLAKPSPKTYFNREWMPVVDAPPGRARRVRAWDRAATEPHAQNTDPDWTAGTRMSYVETEDLYYIEHLEHFRKGPGGVKQQIIDCTETDGFGVEQAFWQDPAGAGKFEAAEYEKSLRSYVCSFWPETKDKITKARPASAAASARPGESYGRFRVVKGPWNNVLFGELEDFPTPGVHDDIVDSVSLAFRVLSSGGGADSEGGVSRDDLRRAGITSGGEEEETDDYGRPKRQPKGGGGYRW